MLMTHRRLNRPRVHRRTTATAFTLVELLVVIGIIGLLLAILLPVLGKARAAARTVACAANLRSIGQAMVMYAAENRGAIPGSGWTSGALFWNFATTIPTPIVRPVTNSPSVSESNDWVGPLARQMGMKDA